MRATFCARSNDGVTQRGSTDDSPTTRDGAWGGRRARWSVCVVGLALASCRAAPLPPPPARPPARQIVVTDGRISLRTSAYLELHAWLTAMAREGMPDEERSDESKLSQVIKNDAEGLRGDRTQPEPAIGAAVRAYRRSIEDDDDDEIVSVIGKRLAACATDACAAEALALRGFGRSYERALPVFIERHWLERATATWAGVEAAHAAIAGGPIAEALLDRARADLGIVSTSQLDVDFVSRTPPVGREALIPSAISARGSCFRRELDEPKGQTGDHLANARLLDCLLVRLLLASQPSSPLLSSKLGEKNGTRAWALLVIHAAAAIVTGWEPRHVSVDRRSARAVESRTLEWLAREWRGARGESPDAFIQRYVEAWASLHGSAPP